jgi:hypothetical protein
VLRCAAVTYFVFYYDATPAVGFKTSGGALITNHEGIRVKYAISGGCSIDHDFKAAASSSGVVDDNIVFNNFVGSCQCSFSAFFGATEGSVVPSTQTNAPVVSRTLIAHSMEFSTSLSNGPLTGGDEYPFAGDGAFLSLFIS